MEKKEKEKMVVEINGVRKVYHYLHNMASSSADVVREKDLLVFELPNIVTSDNFLIKRSSFGFAWYRLQVDPRDQRTLIAFDGHIPWGGLSKGTSVVLTIPDFALLRTQCDYLRKSRPEEEKENHIWFTEDNFANLKINRYFLLVPKVRICLRRYDNKSFRPIYTSVEINDKEIVQPKGVTWRTSSY